MKPVIASVPFLNAKPLITSFELMGDKSPVEVVLNVPSRLPAMVDSGEVQVAMASSFDALLSPGRRIVDGVSISTHRKVESVRLFSQKPFNQITTLALDSASLTSNHLALVLLGELYGIKPETHQARANLDSMLKRADACIMIGDKGLAGVAGRLQVLDLGQAWRELTDLPFVWALWIGSHDLDLELADHLREAKDWGVRHLDEVVPIASKATGFDEDVCRQYLGKTMNYDLTEKHLESHRLFGELLVKQGLLDQAYEAQRV